MILLKFSGVAGFVGTFILTTASPAQTPFIASESCDWTSENTMVLPILILCILIKTPFLNNTAVAWPRPLRKSTPTLIEKEVGVAFATKAVLVNFFLRVDLAKRGFGFLPFAIRFSLVAYSKYRFRLTGLLTSFKL